MARFKSEVHINQELGSDITLELTQEQASKLLDKFMTGAVAHINLQTPTVNGRHREQPEAYAQ